MDKLEVGEWYRHDELEGWIFQFKENQYCKYMDCYDRGLLKGQNQFYKKEYEHYSLLETLTPSEALILLANGFVLKRRGYEYKIFNGKLKYREIRDLCYGPNIFINVEVCDYSGFTIHALPEAKNG